MHYTISDDFETTPERYWQVFFDDAYNDALFEHLRIGRQVLECSREGEGDALVIRRKQILTPEREAPKMLQALVKGAIRYTERNLFTARDDRMTVETIPGFGADKLTTRGVYRLEVLSADKVRRIFDGECTCRVPLLGGKVEKAIVDEVRASYRDTTDFTRRWLREHP
ncbi:MAG: DUF2505 domain-containing protein [Nannocystaceae bacterium]